MALLQRYALIQPGPYVLPTCTGHASPRTSMRTSIDEVKHEVRCPARPHPLQTLCALFVAPLHQVQSKFPVQESAGLAMVYAEVTLHGGMVGAYLRGVHSSARAAAGHSGRLRRAVQGLRDCGAGAVARETPAMVCRSRLTLQ